MHPSIPTVLISRLIPRYGEPHRHYHTWHHIAEVFDASERISSDKSLELTLAIFFHDAVYVPLAKDNEERSADLLFDEGKRAGIDDDVLRDATWLVRQTKHLASPPLSPSHDARPELRMREAVLVDADLSILGSEPKIFDLYEDAVRQEYSGATDAEFGRGRVAVIKNFLDKANALTIFRTERGQNLWEARARENLKKSLGKWTAVIEAS